MNAKIYKITNLLNNKIYVGQTYSTLENRFKKHYRDSSGKNPKNMPIVLAIKKYGINYFKIELLEELSSDLTQLDVDLKEKYWGLKLNSLSPNGYNLKLGNGRGILSEESKLKISKIHKGKLVSAETRLKISKSKKGMKNSVESKNKISQNNSKYWFGKKRSTEDRLKMCKPKKKYKHHFARQILAKCNDKSYIFESAHEASKSNVFDKKIYITSITNCCKMKTKTAGKINGIPVTWSFLN